MLVSAESSLVLAACICALTASCAALSLAFSIEYRVPRESTRAAQASLAGSAHASGTKASPMLNTVVTAIDWLFVIDSSLLKRSVTLLYNCNRFYRLPLLNYGACNRHDRFHDGQRVALENALRSHSQS